MEELNLYSIPKVKDFYELLLPFASLKEIIPNDLLVENNSAYLNASGDL